MMIQYNPHGVFLALEELGYLLMSLSFLFMAPVFAGRSRLESAVGGSLSSPSSWRSFLWG